jgi:hypothetical protein
MVFDKIVKKNRRSKPGHRLTPAGRVSSPAKSAP